MRQILFRGKRIDNGEWLRGGYYKDDCYDMLVWAVYALKQHQQLQDRIKQLEDALGVALRDYADTINELDDCKRVAALHDAVTT